MKPLYPSELQFHCGLICGICLVVCGMCIWGGSIEWAGMTAAIACAAIGESIFLRMREA